MTLLEKGGIPNIQTEVYLCDSANEVASIPSNVPSGSVALILTSEGLTVKMKNNEGQWKEL